MFIESLKLHDEGKKNPFFQAYMGNERYINYKFSKLNKHHTEISAIYYCITMYSRYINKFINIKQRLTQIYLTDIMINFAYNIYKHHSNLDNIDKDLFISNLINYYENNKEQFINIDLANIELLYRLKNRKKCEYANNYTYYLLTKLTYGILIACDFMAVYSHNNKKNLKINYINKNIKNEIETKFAQNTIVRGIRQYEQNLNIPLNELNKYRTEMFLESERNVEKYKDISNIFYLESPTGSGKSLTSLNLSLHLINDTINKVYIVAPYNNINEQTEKVVKESYYKDAVLVNSIEEIFVDENDEFIDYDKDFLNSQMINYPVSLISHVRLFDMIYSCKRTKNMMLPFMCNSVIIIDEVQSYKNSLWIEIINIFKEYAQMLNIKIIIMSATLPKMNELLEDSTYKIPNLIENRQYYYDFFKNRVKYDYSLLKNGKTTLKEIYNKIADVIHNTNKHRILIECLSIKTTETFYNELKKYESDGFKVFKMTAITNSVSRKYIINTVQSKINSEYKYKKIILIGTQCIEAGIDIDMEIGFKNKSILDADEQFAGRIQRNFKETGIVYFFDIDDSNFIYKGDYRTEKDLNDLKWRNIFESKDFDKFYTRCYKWLIENEYDEYKKYIRNLGELQFKAIQEQMTLINAQTYSFLFDCQYENKRSAMDIFSEYKSIEGSELKYSEKQVDVSRIRKELSDYTYNINTYKFKNELHIEKNHGLYIIKDAKEYFDNVKDDKLTRQSNLDIEKFVDYMELFI